MLEDIAVLTGAITGAFTIVSVAWAGTGRWRARRIRFRLELSLARISRQERRLGGAILELDRRLAAGTDWTDRHEWPAQLGGELTYIRGLEDEAEREEASLRSLETTGADERLRADVEEMQRLLALVAAWSVDGTLRAHRRCEGRPTEHPVARPEMSLVFTGVNEIALRDARRRFTTLMRTCLHRLGHGDPMVAQRAEGAESAWCIYRWEVDSVDLDRYWGGEVRPVRWD